MKTIINTLIRRIVKDVEFDYKYGIRYSLDELVQRLLDDIEKHRLNVTVDEKFLSEARQSFKERLSYKIRK